jgi:hypothetical protein
VPFLPREVAPHWRGSTCRLVFGDTSDSDDGCALESTCGRVFDDKSAPPEQFLGGGSASLNQLHIAPNQPSLRAVSSNTTDDTCLDAYQRELDYLMRTLRRLGVASGEVEDLAHEVFLILRRAWHEYDPARPLKPYIFGIAFRVAASTALHRVLAPAQGAPRARDRHYTYAEKE